MILKVAGWLAIALSVAILLEFAGLRLQAMLEGAAASDAFDIRYAEHPIIALLHILPGLLFLLVAPLQSSRASASAICASIAGWAGCWSAVPS